jgi:hypothetical protein
MLEKDGSLRITSSELLLNWHVRRADFPGTAISWQGRLYEVFGGGQVETGWVWHLVPWDEGQVARVVMYFGKDRVAELAAVAADDERRSQRYRQLRLLLPLVGLLPNQLQGRLEREYGFPAERATVVSALLEIAGGFAGVLQALALMRGGAEAWFLPPPLRWLAAVGPVIAIEGMIRLWFSATQGEGIGSVFTSPLLLFLKPEDRGPKPEDFRPTAPNWRPGVQELELVTVEARTDWKVDGVLRFRGRSYRLDSIDGRGELYLYRFEAVPGDTPLTLTLLPPEKEVRQRDAGSQGGPLALALKFVLMSLAPGDFQERWFTALGRSARAATACSAGIMAFGGAMNLVNLPGGPLRILDVFLLVEGLIRLALVLVRGEAVGSLLGLPFQALYRRWAASGEGTADPPPSA